MKEKYLFIVHYRGIFQRNQSLLSVYSLSVIPEEFASQYFFNVGFYVDDKVWVENMHILANMRSNIRIKGRLFIN